MPFFFFFFFFRLLLLLFSREKKNVPQRGGVALFADTTRRLARGSSAARRPLESIDCVCFVSFFQNRISFFLLLSSLSDLGTMESVLEEPRNPLSDFVRAFDL